MVLDTDAPVLKGSIRVGVFARDENVSTLLHSYYFLPTCYHRSRVHATLNLTLSKVSNGAIWAQEAAVPQLSNLVPSSPLLLQPYLTGQYQCTSPGLAASSDKYRLDVVGEEESRFEQ